jgi:hypothetical protein
LLLLCLSPLYPATLRQNTTKNTHAPLSITALSCHLSEITRGL